MIFQKLELLYYEKFHKLKLKKNKKDTRYFFPKQTLFGLQVLRCGKLTAEQIEACRLVIRRGFKKSVIIKINVFPFISITKKSTASRMGKGKGKPFKWICPVKKGRVVVDILPLFLLKRAMYRRAERVLNVAGKKLPIKSKAIHILY